MSKLLRIPAYRLHKPKQLAVVRLNGRDIYLGPYNSPESRQVYDRLIAEWLAAGRQTLPTGPAASNEGGPSINELLVAYLTWARGYYASPDGDGKEYVNLTHALRPLRDLYGSLPAVQFGPQALKAVRQHMIDVQQLCRTEINKRIGRIRRVFKWAVAEELVASGVLEALRAVDGLRRGRTGARENAPVRPVDSAQVEAILPLVSRQVAAMIQLQLLTGMRPGEVVQLRPVDLDRTGPIWFYTPPTHKTQYLGHAKRIPLGPQAQALLAPFLERGTDMPCFSPQEAEAERNAGRASQRRPDRKTKIFPCELRARERRRAAAKIRPSRRPKRTAFDVASYRRAIEYGILKAQRQGLEIAHWHPHQLRHSRATEIRKRYGVEAAQVVLGHTRADVTQIYAERNDKLAEKIAAEIG